MRYVRSAAIVVGMAVLVAGCSGSEEEPGPVPEPERTASLTAEALLPADEMPSWNDATVWTTVASLPAAQQALGVCGLPSAISLGAAETVEQEYQTVVPEEAASETPIAGVNQVSRFTNPTQAAEAVAAWEQAMQDCAPGPVGAGERQSSQISDLPEGSTWTVSARLPDTAEDSRFDFVGFASSGDRTTVVGFSLTGQDANWETDPLAEAMSASLERIG